MSNEIHNYRKSIYDSFESNLNIIQTTTNNDIRYKIKQINYLYLDILKTINDTTFDKFDKKEPDCYDGFETSKTKPKNDEVTIEDIHEIPNDPVVQTPELTQQQKWQQEDAAEDQEYKNIAKKQASRRETVLIFSKNNTLLNECFSIVNAIKDDPAKADKLELPAMSKILKHLNDMGFVDTTKLYENGTTDILTKFKSLLESI